MIHTLSMIGLAVVLGLAAWQDIKERKISNKINVAGVLAGVAFSLIDPERTFLAALAGVGISFAVGFACWMMKIFRAGDAKLMCAVGAFVGWKMSLNCLLVAVVIGAIVGIPLVIRRLIKKEKGFTQFPFATAIAGGCLIGINIGYIWEVFQWM